MSLTIIRMVPVALSLVGARLDLATTLYVGWFGPRGIASLLYLLILITTLGADGYETVISIISLTIILSIFAHGITALPLTKQYVKFLGD